MRPIQYIQPTSQKSQIAQCPAIAGSSTVPMDCLKLSTEKLLFNTSLKVLK